MPLYTDVPTPLQIEPQLNLAPTFNQKLEAAMSDAWNSSYGPVVEDWFNAKIGDTINIDPVQSQITTQQPAALLDQTSIDTKVSQAGYDPKEFKISPNKYSDGVVDDLIERRKQQLINQEIESKTDWDLVESPIRGVGILAAGILDPINVASAFFPVAKLASAFKLTGIATTMAGLELTAKTAQTLGARSAARAATGAIEGLAGTAILEPAYSYMRQDLGDDYTMYNSAVNLVGGAIFGGLLQPIMGGFGDLVHGVPKAPIKEIEPAKQPLERVTSITADEEFSVDREITISPVEEPMSPELVKQIVDKIDGDYKTSLIQKFTRQIEAIADKALPDILPQEKILLASEKIKAVDEMILGDEFSLNSDIKQAIDRLSPDNDFIPSQGFIEADTTITPEAELLASWIGQPSTTPRMVAEAINSYHKDILAQLKAEGEDYELSPIDKLQTLQKYVDSIQPIASEKTVLVSPQTRDTALKVGVSQVLEGKKLSIEKIIDNDPVLNKATPAEVRQEYIEANKVENSEIAQNTTPLDIENINPDIVQEDIPFDNIPLSKVKQEIERIKADTEAVIQQLYDEGTLYSQALTEPTQITNKATLTEALKQSFGKSTQKLIDSSLVNVVDTVAELPARPDGQPHPSNVKAMAQGGKVYVVANMVTPEEASGIMLHEVGVHTGLKVMLGKDKFNVVLDNVDRLVNQDDQIANIANDAVPSDTPAANRREEVLAYMMENAPTHNIVTKVIAEVRAWLFKNFNFAKGFDLTNADIWALTKASLHKVAEGSALIDNEVMYSRIGSAEEVQSFKQEMQAYKDAEATIEEYANGLRAVFNIADRDAAKLMLRKNTGMKLADADKIYNKFMRKVNSYTREAAQGNTPAEYVGVPIKERALNTIKEQELYELSVAARAKAYNFRSQVDMYNRINNGFMQPNELGKLGNKAAEGAYSITKGSKLSRPDANVSIGSRQQMFIDKYKGSLFVNVEREGLWQYFSSGNSQDEIMRAQLALNTGEDVSKFIPEAVKVAEIISKIYNKTIEDRNLRGTTIRKNKQYIFDGAYMFDQATVRNISLEEFQKDMTEALDLGAMATSQDVNIAIIINEMPEIRENFAKGRQQKYTEDQVDTSLFGTPNIAKKTSKSRTLIWKDADAQIKIFNKYSNKKFAEAVGMTLDKAGKQTGILDVAGPSYEDNIKKVMDAISLNIINDKERDYFNATVKQQIEYDLQHLDGSANIPLSYTLARNAAIIRSNNRLAMLGSSLMSQVSDLAVAASSIKFQGGDGYLTGIPKLIKGMLTRYDNEEGRAILNGLGTVSDSYMAAAFDRSGIEDGAGKIWGNMERIAFKVFGVNWWTNKMHTIAGDGFMTTLGSFNKTAHEALPDTLRRTLSDYGIGVDEWNILRQGATEVRGKQWIIPDTVAQLRPQMEQLITGKAGELTPDVLAKRTNIALGKLEDSLRSYYSDLIYGSTAEPTARVKIAVAGHAKKGTWGGEMWNMFTQFKMFPTSFVQGVLGRQVYKRGYDTFKDLVMSGKGDMLGLVQLMLASTMCGAVSLGLKDLIKGKTQRDYQDPKTWAAAMAQGGGLGIYGDFLFSDVSRLQGGPFEALAGPTFGTAGRALVLAMQTRDYLVGSDKEPSGSAAVNLAVNNIPFVNTFWLKPILNYLMLYNLQETMNPGFMARQESKLMRDTGQEYYPFAREYLGQ